MKSKLLNFDLKKRFLKPSFYFDTDFYLSNNDDVRKSGANPFSHYLKHGDRELRRPSVYFDPNFYIKQASGCLNANEGPLSHYLRSGAAERRSPNPYFDPVWYESRVKANSAIPDLFLHYATEGWKEGLSPSPYFNVKWYLAMHRDVAQAGIEPLRHYVEFGSTEGRQPTPYFDPRYYVATNTDVRESRIEPLSHYIQWGWREKDREPNLLFDKAWYAETEMGSLAGSADPLRHFIEHSENNDLAPTPDFDPVFYKRQSPELTESDNAYRHFLLFGRAVGRRPNASSPKPVRRDLIEWARANTLRDQAVASLRSMLGPSLKTGTAVEDAAATFMRTLGQVDAVSFDIFDTLIERASGAPESVFALVALEASEHGYTKGDFSEMRMQAERKARERAGRQEIRLADIYDEFSMLTACSGAVTQSLMRAEIARELAVCVPKPFGRMLFDAAVSAEKRLFLMTDIYLSQETIVALLVNCGYTNYSKLYVSSELGATKHYGGLFKYLLADTGLTAEQIVHVGDNPHSDGEMAREAGLKALLIQKPASKRKDHSIVSSEGAISDSPIWRGLIEGATTAGLMRGHSSLKTSIGLNSASHSVGTRVLGPLLLNFSLFLAKKTSLGNYDKLFFASRDGFYLKEAYDIVRRYVPNLPASQYFYASRKVCRLAMVRTIKDIVDLASVDHYPMPIGNFLRARFTLSDEEIATVPGLDTNLLEKIVTDARDDADLTRVLTSAKSIILASAEEHRRAYLDYLSKIGFSDGRAAIVDVGYRGTIQSSLGTLTGQKLGGMYLLVWPAIEQLWDTGQRFDAFVRLDQDAGDIINRNLQLLELLLSGTHPSINRFERKQGMPYPRLEPIDTVAASRETLNDVRKAALEFVRDVCEIYTSQITSLPVDSAFVLDAFRNLLRMPPVDFVDGLKYHDLEDSFGGETRSLIVSPADGVDFNQALERSSWKEGTVALWKAYRRGFVPATTDCSEVPTDIFDGYVSRAAVNV